jgi:hypothetical protein
VFASICTSIQEMPPQPHHQNSACQDGVGACVCSSLTGGTCESVASPSQASWATAGGEIAQTFVGSACGEDPLNDWTVSSSFHCDSSALGFGPGSPKVVRGLVNGTTDPCNVTIQWATNYVCGPFPSPAESRVLSPSGKPAPGSGFSTALKAGSPATQLALFQLRDQFRDVLLPKQLPTSFALGSNCSTSVLQVQALEPDEAMGAYSLVAAAPTEPFGFQNTTCSVNITETPAMTMVSLLGTLWELTARAPAQSVWMVSASQVPAGCLEAQVPLCTEEAREMCVRSVSDGFVVLQARGGQVWLEHASWRDSTLRMCRLEPLSAGATDWRLFGTVLITVMPSPLGPKGPGGLSPAEMAGVVVGTIASAMLLVGLGVSIRRADCCRSRAGGYRLSTTWRRDHSNDRARGVLAPDGSYRTGTPEKLSAPLLSRPSPAYGAVRADEKHVSSLARTGVDVSELRQLGIDASDFDTD